MYRPARPYIVPRVVNRFMIPSADGRSIVRGWERYFRPTADAAHNARLVRRSMRRAWYAVPERSLPVATRGNRWSHGPVADRPANQEDGAEIGPWHAVDADGCHYVRIIGAVGASVAKIIIDWGE